MSVAQKKKVATNWANTFGAINAVKGVSLLFVLWLPWRKRDVAVCSVAPEENIKKSREISCSRKNTYQSNGEKVSLHPKEVKTEKLKENATLALKYRKDARDAFMSLESLPNNFRQKFLDRLDASPDGNVQTLVTEITSEYESWLKPYESEEANAALNEVRKLGQEAEKEFKRVIAILGDSVDYAELLSKIKDEYEVKPKPIDEITKRYGMNFNGLLKEFKIKYDDERKSYIYNDAEYDSYLDAIISADTERRLLAQKRE